MGFACRYHRNDMRNEWVLTTACYFQNILTLFFLFFSTSSGPHSVCASRFRIINSALISLVCLFKDQVVRVIVIEGQGLVLLQEKSEDTPPIHRIQLTKYFCFSESLSQLFFLVMLTIMPPVPLFLLQALKVQFSVSSYKSIHCAFDYNYIQTRQPRPGKCFHSFLESYNFRKKSIAETGRR